MAVQITASVVDAISRYHRHMTPDQARFSAWDWWTNSERARKEYPRREDFQDAVFSYLSAK